MSASNFFSELKRRQIYRGGVMYVVAGWVIVQVATTLFPIFNIPEWAIRLVVVGLMLGFPLALVGLWMFESTGHRLASPPPQVERRRRSDGDGDALARLVEAERAERQRSNEELLAALGRLQGAAGGDPHAATPPPPPAPHAATPARLPRPGTILLAVFVCILAAWGIWILVAPATPIPRVDGAGKLTHDYVLPAYRQAEQVGAALLEPLLRRVGIDIAPERVFTAVMMVIALLVLRNLYRSMIRARRPMGGHG